MKIIRLLLSSILVCFSFISIAQFTVSGRVIDSASREPLSSASVFCHNTTIGTSTNKKGEFSLDLKSGGYELVVTYTGYQPKFIRITDTAQNGIEIEMIKQEKNMEEVVIRNSNEVADGWEKYGKFFLENFIGSTPNAELCTLKNPEALKFYYYKKSDRLKILAEAPLQISNKA